MENVFDLPEGMQNEAPDGGAQPNMEPLPDQLIPPENEAPATTTTEEPQQPATAPEVEQLPDQLIPPDEPAAAPPETSSMHEPRDLEELPFDAPEGDLIPETAQPVAAKPRPGLLMPTEPRRAGERQSPRIENAMRPGTRQGAKVLLSQPENALRELAGGKAKVTPTAEDAFADGPQLMTPSSAVAETTASKQEPSKVESSNWQSTRSASRRARMTMPMAVTTVPEANATADEQSDTSWRPSRARGNMQGPALQSTAAREQIRSPRQGAVREYPTMQVGHTENVMRDDASSVGTTAGAANPLR
jgi:hypothetical protein